MRTPISRKIVDDRKRILAGRLAESQCWGFVIPVEVAGSAEVLPLAVATPFSS